MKKIVCFLLLISTVSCGNYNANHTGPNGEVRPDSEAMLQHQLKFLNVYQEGNWHEVVVNDGLYAGGIMHWPDCKFCKEKNGKK